MSFHDCEATWFLAQIKPNAITIAERNLLRQGFRTFVPREQGTKRAHGRFVAAEQPFFPGYIFVGLKLSKGGWQAINSTYGITRLVSFGGEPAQVPPDLINDLMLRCDETGKILPPERLQAGDQVRLTSGPFAHFLAEVETIAPDQRVWVLMELMGGRTRVKVSTDSLQKAR